MDLRRAESVQLTMFMHKPKVVHLSLSLCSGNQAIKTHLENVMSEIKNGHYAQNCLEPWKFSIPTFRRVVGGPTLSGLRQYVLICISDDTGNKQYFG